MKPLIAISGRRWLGSTISGLPDNFRGLGVDLHIGAYADAVAAAGGIPVLLPSSPDAIDALARVDALVLTGGADVDPSFYGEVPHESVTATEPERDAVELALAKRAVTVGLPLFAVCRGMQILNVAMGGSLVQHLDVTDESGDHGAWSVPVESLVHRVSFEAGSLAQRVYGKSCAVNSLHHQAVKTLGAGILATGRSDDGVVEAAELPGRSVLAVQWHPELLAESPEPGFAWLVAAARH